MKAIHKFRLFPMPIAQQIYMPRDAKILSAGLDRFGDVCIWAEVDTSKAKETRTMWCVGTGWDLTNVELNIFIDTVVDNMGEVWHIYEEIKHE